MRRAVASIVLNIAEGNARKSQSERRRFFEIARASAAEVSSCLDLAFAFRLTGQQDVQGFKSMLQAISKMLWALMK
jgi:four helix bundle protein